MSERELPWALRVERAEGDRPGWPSRSEWGDGPWNQEPDIVEWRHVGMPCLIVRNGSGSLCGYAGVSPGHPFHGKHYNEAYDAPGVDLNVHGGLTYASACAGDICHVPQPGEEDSVWWLGFDCAHSGDLSPGLRAHLSKHGGAGYFDHDVYRDINYVRGEVESLAEQLKAMT